MNDTQWSAPRRALIFLTAAFTVAFLLLVGRLAYIQLAGGEKLRNLAQEQQTMRLAVPSLRGAVVDRTGRPLAATVESYSVFADPRLFLEGLTERAARSGDAADRGAAVAQLASVLGLDAADADRKIGLDAQKRFVWLKRRVNLPTKQAVQALRIRGIGVIPEGDRAYPAEGLAAQLLGTTGADNQGLDGLEYLLDRRLKGSDGYQVVLVDGKRRPVAAPRGQAQGPADGQVVVLTIDLSIQMFTEEALKEAVDEFHARGGMAIVMDPATGEILALANYPSFDPANFSTVDDYARRNRLLTDPYEPGSTFKCFIAPVALERGLVRPGERIFCHNGVYRIRGRTLRDVHAYGVLSFEDIVVKSSNIGMGIIGMRMGNARLYEALKRFGFGERTGILLPGESPGLVHPFKYWTSLSATSIPMGYEVMVTPLQMITAFSSIANGGVLLRPRLVRHVYAPDGRVVADLSRPVAVRRTLRRETADYMREHILRDVVTRGTGTRGQIPGYQVFGKTGTAKKRNPDGQGYSETLYYGSFIGSAPLKSPRLVVMVVIDEPQRSRAYFGGSVAAPAVKQILERSLGYLHVPPDEALRLARSPGQSAWD